MSCVALQTIGFKQTGRNIVTLMWWKLNPIVIYVAENLFNYFPLPHLDFSQSHAFSLMDQ